MSEIMVFTQYPDDENMTKLHVGFGMEKLGSCLLCKSEKVAGVGIFEPNEPSDYCLTLAPEGKTVRHLFALCEECWDANEKSGCYMVQDAVKAKYDQIVPTEETVVLGEEAFNPDVVFFEA
jgi:hypothetical protein